MFFLLCCSLFADQMEDLSFETADGDGRVTAKSKAKPSCPARQPKGPVKKREAKTRSPSSKMMAGPMVKKSIAKTRKAPKAPMKSNVDQEKLAEELFEELEGLAAEAAASTPKMWRQGRTIRLGSDCAGLGSDYVSLRIILDDSIKIKTKFVAEMDENKLQWLKAIASFLGNDTPEIIYKNVLERDNDNAPDLDIFVSGAPCPPFSSAGAGGGMADSRGWLILHSVKYVLRKRPPIFVLENVRGLTTAKHKWILKRISKCLTKAGYKCHCSLLSTEEHGIPQSRPRVYLVAILKKCIARPFQFPDPVDYQSSLKRFLGKDHGAKKTKLSEVAAANVKRAMLV